MTMALSLGKDEPCMCCVGQSVNRGVVGGPIASRQDLDLHPLVLAGRPWSPCAGRGALPSHVAFADGLSHGLAWRLWFCLFLR
jgi:hypothetical protein